MMTNISMRGGLFGVDLCQSGSTLIKSATIPAVVDDEIHFVV